MTTCAQLRDYSIVVETSHQMQILTGSRLFGSQRRTEVLIDLGLLEETYSREPARVLDAPLLSVQWIVDSLERESALATRLIGRERRVTLSPRYFAVRELRPLLACLADADERLVHAVEVLRRRPRKRGKLI